MNQQAGPKRSRWVFRILRGVAAFCVVLTLGVYGFVRGSLATLDGEVKGNGLQARATVTRDALGIPTITAGNRLDAAYVTGYLHGQDRFFQMDLLRRGGARGPSGQVCPSPPQIFRPPPLRPLCRRPPTLFSFPTTPAS